MVFMEDGIEMDTQLQGLSSAMSRALTGQNLFWTDFRYTGDNPQGATVALGTAFPSKLLRLSLSDYTESSLIGQRGAFVASNPTTELTVEFTQSLTAGLFGGQGFCLQRLTGSGDVLVQAGGTVVHKVLEADETIRVTSGSIVAFEPSVHYTVQTQSKLTNVLFGGEGLFVTTLTGPGHVWLQGLPADRMCAEIARRIPAGSSGIGWGIPIGMGGGSSSGDATTAAAGDGVDGTAAASAEAAIEADRQATVASSATDLNPDSGVDANSPQALFGDAAPSTATTTTTSTTNPMDPSPQEETAFSSDSSPSNETTFQDDDMTSFSTDSSSSSSSSSFWDTTTDDDPFANNTSNGPADGELFDDTGNSNNDDNDNDDDGDGGGLFGMLWDVFSGGGDE